MSFAACGRRGAVDSRCHSPTRDSPVFLFASREVRCIGPRAGVHAPCARGRGRRWGETRVRQRRARRGPRTPPAQPAGWRRRPPPPLLARAALPPSPAPLPPPPLHPLPPPAPVPRLQLPEQEARHRADRRRLARIL